MRLKNLLPKKVYNKLYEHFKRVIISDLKSTKCQYELNIKDVGKLEGKIAIVTGGSGAIGSAICFRLAMEGATVIVCGRNKEKIDEVVAQIEENDGNAYGCILDVTNEEDIENKFDDVRNTGLVIEKNINNKAIIIKKPYFIENCVIIFLFIIFAPQYYLTHQYCSLYSEVIYLCLFHFRIVQKPFCLN